MSQSRISRPSTREEEKRTHVVGGISSLAVLGRIVLHGEHERRNLVALQDVSGPVLACTPSSVSFPLPPPESPPRRQDSPARVVRNSKIAFVWTKLFPSIVNLGTWVVCQRDNPKTLQALHAPAGMGTGRGPRSWHGKRPSQTPRTGSCRERATC